MTQQNILIKIRQIIRYHIRKLRRITNVLHTQSVNATLVITEHKFLWSYKTILSPHYFAIFDPSQPKGTGARTGIVCGFEIQSQSLHSNCTP